jgi:Zn-dependent protease with chaperone function
MAQIFFILLVIVPLVRLALAILQPELLKHIEGERTRKLVVRAFGQPRRSARVTAIGDKVAAAAGLEATFWVVPAPILNAATLPHGHVLVWEGLERHTRGDDDMLAGVLAHELGHLQHEHYLKRIERWALVLFALGVFGRAWIGPFVRNVASSIVLRGFGRADELQADDWAFEVLPKAGYDPRGLARLFETLRPYEGPSGLLGTHPDAGLRQQRVLTRLGLPFDETEETDGTGRKVIPFAEGRRGDEEN